MKIGNFNKSIEIMRTITASNNCYKRNDKHYKKNLGTDVKTRIRKESKKSFNKNAKKYIDTNASKNVEKCNRCGSYTCSMNTCDKCGLYICSMNTCDKCESNINNYGCYYGTLKTIPKLPESLKYLTRGNSTLKTIPELPKTFYENKSSSNSSLFSESLIDVFKDSDDILAVLIANNFAIVFVPILINNL